MHTQCRQDANTACTHTETHTLTHTLTHTHTHPPSHTLTHADQGRQDVPHNLFHAHRDADKLQTQTPRWWPSFCASDSSDPWTLCCELSANQGIPSTPAHTWRRLKPEGGLALASKMRRFLDFPLSTSKPSGVYDGAITIS
jgi:hypothetical protein